MKCYQTCLTNGKIDVARQVKIESLFNNILDADFATWNCGIDSADPYGLDRAWRHSVFNVYPEHIANELSAGYKATYETHGRHEAAWSLANEHQRLAPYVLQKVKHYDEICKLADMLARKYTIASSDRSPEQAIETFASWVRAQGIGLPQNVSFEGAHARLKDPVWWKRQLSRKMIQGWEQVALLQGNVSMHSNIYVSIEGLRYRHEQKARMHEYLTSISAVNEEGTKLNLLEVAEHSLSNPRNRRAELMTIISGFENYADDKGYVGVFITITCPSRMHAAPNKLGKVNSKYDGTSPKQAQKYLTTSWSRMRAKLKRENIKFFGTRIVEPQHDGTPHWHILFFVDPNKCNQLLNIMRHYALQENGSEKGAKKHRFVSKMIDKKKGSAAGYIAKYVSKNIDGYGLTEGIYGESPYDTAGKVEAWASLWGIRQFQHFGGPPVGVYRELRRYRKPIKESKVLEKCRLAADEHDWKKFIEVMGGIEAKRNEHVVSTEKQWLEQLGVYGEPRGDTVIGVTDGTVTIVTREHTWTVEFSPLDMGKQPVLCEASSAPLGHGPAEPAPASARDVGVPMSRAENST